MFWKMLNSTKGYKTHVVVALLVVNALVAYYFGDQVDVNVLVRQILEALGYSTIRIGIKELA